MNYTEWSYASEVSPYLQAMGPAHRRNRILCIGLRPEIGRLLDENLVVDLGIKKAAAKRISELQKQARKVLGDGISTTFGNRDVPEGN